MNYNRATTDVPDTAYRLVMTDTSGREISLEKTYVNYEGAMIIFVTFDITNLDTFQKLPKFIEEIEARCPAWSV